jgi:HEAT repeat protein
MTGRAMLSLVSVILGLWSSGSAFAQTEEKPVERTAEQWVKELESGDAQRIGEAMLALEALGPKAAPVVPQLAQLLERDNPDNRRHILSIFRAIGPGSKPALPAIRAKLFHDDFHTQYWACRAVGAIGAEAIEAAPDLRQLLRPNYTASARRNAAIALGLLGSNLDERSVDALVTTLRDRIHPVREEAARALGRLGKAGRSAIPELRIALVDGKRDIRSTCALSLWKLTGEAGPVLPPLVEELGEGHRPWEAAEVFAELGPEGAPAVDSLIKLLQSDNAEVRMSALDSLGHIGEPARRAIPEIEKRLQDEEEEVVEFARDNLKKLAGDPQQRKARANNADAEKK